MNLLNNYRIAGERKYSCAMIIMHRENTKECCSRSGYPLRHSRTTDNSPDQNLTCQRLKMIKAKEISFMQQKQCRDEHFRLNLASCSTVHVREPKPKQDRMKSFDKHCKTQCDITVCHLVQCVTPMMVFCPSHGYCSAQGSRCDDAALPIC